MNNYKYEINKRKILELTSNVESKYKIIKYSAIIALLIIIIVISLSFIHFKENDFGYDLYGESKNFTISNSAFLLIKNKYYLNYGNFEIKNNNIKVINTTLMAGDRLIISSSDFLQSSSQEYKGYDELFPDDVVKNLNNWHYKITYILNDKENTEIINLENRKWNINQKVNSIS